MELYQFASERTELTEPLNHNKINLRVLWYKEQQEISLSEVCSKYCAILQNQY